MVNNETPFFVISSRIRVPSENGPFRVDIRQPPSLKSVVKPSSCIPEIVSVALILATNAYLGALFPVGADSTATSTLKDDTRRHASFPIVNQDSLRIPSYSKRSCTYALLNAAQSRAPQRRFCSTEERENARVVPWTPAWIS